MKKINLFEALKAKGVTLEDAEKKMLDELSGELNTALEAVKAGSMTESDFQTKFDEGVKTITLAAKNVKVGEGDTAKSIEDILREQGGEITKLQQAGGAIDLSNVSMQDVIGKMLPEIEKVYNAKTGVVKLDVNKAAAVMTTANTIDEATFSVPAAIIESMNMLDFVAKRYGTQYVAEIADVTTVAAMEQYTTWLEEGSEQGAFAVVAEGALKPLVSYALVRNFAAAQKIAGKYVVTEEFSKFRNNAYNIIRRLIVDKMIRDYSALLVTGINTASAAYTGTTLDGTILAPNDYDAIGAVAAQIQSLNFNPNVLILHPQDAWRIRLEKNSQGAYLFPVVTADGQTQMMGVQLIISTYQTPGYFTLGEKGLYKIEQEGLTVRLGYGIDVTGSNPVTAVVSDFDNNRFRTIVEMFFKQWLPTPYIGSFVRTQFSTVKTALLAP